MLACTVNSSCSHFISMFIFISTGHETQEEQKQLNEMVEKLQLQLSQNECDLKNRESKLRRQQDQIEEDRR